VIREARNRGGYNGPSTLTFTLSPDGGGIDRMAMAD